MSTEKTTTIRIGKVESIQSTDELKKIEEKIDRGCQSLLIFYCILDYGRSESTEKSPIERWAEEK